MTDGSRKRQKTETEALINRYGLILLVPPTGVPYHHKEGDLSIFSFFTSYMHAAGFSAMNTKKSKNRSRLQTLEEDFWLVNHPTSEKGHHET
jgi:hypothetical protein